MKNGAEKKRKRAANDNKLQRTDRRLRRFNLNGQFVALVSRLLAFTIIIMVTFSALLQFVSSSWLAAVAIRNNNHQLNRVLGSTYRTGLHARICVLLSIHCLSLVACAVRSFPRPGMRLLKILFAYPSALIEWCN